MKRKSTWLFFLIVVLLLLFVGMVFDYGKNIVWDTDDALPSMPRVDEWTSLVTGNERGNKKIMQAVNVLSNHERPESDLRKCFSIITKGNTPEIEFHTACAIAGWYYWNKRLPDSVSVIMTKPGPDGIQPIVESYIETGVWTKVRNRKDTQQDNPADASGAADF